MDTNQNIQNQNNINNINPQNYNQNQNSNIQKFINKINNSIDYFIKNIIFRNKNNNYIPNIQNDNNNNNNNINNDNSNLNKISLYFKKFPFTVFYLTIIITIFYLINFLFSLISYYSFSYIYNLLFIYFVWVPLAIELEKSSGSTRYILSIIIHCSFLTILLPLIFGLGLNLYFFYYFCLYETLIVCRINQTNIIKFFIWNIQAKNVSVFSVLFGIIFNLNYLFYFILFGIYYLISIKYLNKNIISDEKVIYYENGKIFSLFKNNIRYINFNEVKNNNNINENNNINIENNNIIIENNNINIENNNISIENNNNNSYNNLNINNNIPINYYNNNNLNINQIGEQKSEFFNLENNSNNPVSNKINI